MAPERARELGCDALQFFCHSPRNWNSIKISEGEKEDFLSRVRSYGIRSTAIHSSYLINLASPDEILFKKSAGLLIKELEIGEELGVDFLIVHPGSTRGRDVDFGIKRVREALTFISRSRCGSTVTLLLENTAGSGHALGGSLVELKKIMDGLDCIRLGICFDTCHAFAAGYEISGHGDVDRLVDNIRGEVGLESLRLIHLNDSMAPLGSNVDRHQHLGSGRIGLEGLGALIRHPALREIPIIMETPKGSEKDDQRNLSVPESSL